MIKTKMIKTKEDLEEFSQKSTIHIILESVFAKIDKNYDANEDYLPYACINVNDKDLESKIRLLTNEELYLFIEEGLIIINGKLIKYTNDGAINFIGDVENRFVGIRRDLKSRDGKNYTLMLEDKYELFIDIKSDLPAIEQTFLSMFMKKQKD